MARRLLNLLTVLSLLGCGAVAALWVRSYRRGDRVDFVRGRVEGGDHVAVWGEVASLNGGLGVYVVWHSLAAEDVRRYWPDLMHNRLALRPAAQDRTGYPPARAVPDWQRAGFNYTYRLHENPSPTPNGKRSYHHQRGFTVPHWLLAVVFAFPFAARLLRRRRRHIAAREVRCVRCGYNLRATPGRCPECGAVPAGTAT